MQQPLTQYQSQYYAWLLTRRAAGDSVESLASTLVDSQVDLNPHQVDAALFACRNPLSRGVLLADEVGLGKTIEAGLVISQRWAERRRKILIIVPANLRKQWHQELQDKFGLQGLILEAKSYNAIRKKDRQNPFLFATGPVICSYQFAKSKADDVKSIDWDLVVLDEAHRLRNVYKTSNVIAKTLKEALSHVHSKVLLTATPLQNSLFELYGLRNLLAGNRPSMPCVTDWLPSASALCANKFSAMCRIRRARPSSRNSRRQTKNRNCPDSSLITCVAPT